MALSPSNAVTQAPGAQRTRLAQTYAYYAAFIMLGLTAASLGPTLPWLAKHVNSSIGQISYLFTVRSLGYLAGSLLAGRLYDRVKGHPLMAGVVFLMAATMFTVPVIPLLWLLGLVLLLVGIAEGILDVGGNTLLVWVHRAEMRPFMNGLHFFFGLGALISPIIVAQSLSLTGEVVWAYWALVMLMLPSAFWLARLPSPAARDAGESGPSRPPLPLLIALLALFAYLYVGVEVAFGGWIYSYTVRLGLGSQTSAAYLTSLFWGALTAGRLFSIPIAARFKPHPVLLVDLLIVLGSLLLIVALPGSVTVLWIGAAGVGLGMASIFPTMLALAEQHMHITGKITSWFFAGSSMGAMTLPWVIGQLFERIGPQVTMQANTAFAALSLVVFFVIVAYTRTLKPH